MKINYKKNIKNTCIVVIFLMISILSFIGVTKIEPSIQTTAEETVETVNTVQRVPSLEDNFEDNRVIVTLKSEYSGINKAVDIQGFRTEKLLTYKDVSDSQRRNISSDIPVIEGVEDLTHFDNPSKMKDCKNFTQILSLTLDRHSKENVLRTIKELNRLECVLAAEPAYIYEISWDSAPSDSSFSNQWGLHGDFGIDILPAWNYTTGETNPKIKVGIFEEGIDEDHPDLRVIEGYHSTIGDYGVDHGSHVAGIIGAIADNDMGIAGIAPVEIALLKITSFVSSITWAIDNDIKIINASFGFGEATADTSHMNAIRLFGESGGILIASAGNNSENTDVVWHFPSGYADERSYPEITNVISVGAIDRYGERLIDLEEMIISNYGENSVSIYAPGGEIYSTLSNGEYGYRSGTSMAAPHVTGVAALMMAVNPALTAAQIKDKILASADTITITLPNNSTQQVKKLNAYKAVCDAAYIRNAAGNEIMGIHSYESSALEIPSVIGGVTITSIGSSAFANQTGITSVTIPNTVTSIGDGAFWCCSNLETVNLPSSLTTIGSAAFFGCTSLQEIEIPPSVEIIGASAFYNCYDLSDITLLSGLQAISSELFFGCTSLTNITIPSSVTYIADKAFKNCSALTSITIPSGVTHLGKYIFYGCDGLQTIYYNARDCYTTSIWGETFPEYNPSINGFSLIIGNNVTHIPANLFAETNVSSVTIGTGVNDIGSGVFNGCERLATVNYNAENCTTYPASGGVFPSTGAGFKVIVGNLVQMIPAYFCYNAKVTELTVGRLVHSIGNHAFNGCTNLTKINFNSTCFDGFSDGNQSFMHVTDSGAPNVTLVVGNGVTLLPDWTFAGMKITSVSLPSGLTRIGNYAFEGCTSLTSASIPSSVTSIGTGAFSDATSLRSVTLRTGLTSIENGAFYNCALTSLTLPSGLTSIGNYAFEGCDFAEVTLPASVEYVGAGAFLTGTTSGTLYIERPSSTGLITLGAAYENVFSFNQIYVPDANTQAAYMAASNWYSVRNNIHVVPTYADLSAWVFVTDMQTVDSQTEDGREVAELLRHYTFRNVMFNMSMSNPDWSGMIRTVYNDAPILFYSTGNLYTDYDAFYQVMMERSSRGVWSVLATARDVYYYQSNACFQMVGDSYLLGYEMGTAHKNWVDMIFSGCIEDMVGSLGYYPVIAPVEYRYNTMVLMGLSDAFKAPVKILSEASEVAALRQQLGRWPCPLIADMDWMTMQQMPSTGVDFYYGSAFVRDEQEISQGLSMGMRVYRMSNSIPTLSGAAVACCANLPVEEVEQFVERSEEVVEVWKAQGYTTQSNIGSYYSTYWRRRFDFWTQQGYSGVSIQTFELYWNETWSLLSGGTDTFYQILFSVRKVYLEQIVTAYN